MKQAPMVRSFIRSPWMVLAWSALLLPSTPLQACTVQETKAAVFASHYAFAGRNFSGAAALAAAVGEAGPHAVGLDVCGAGTTRALMSAVYRLRDWPLHLRVRGMDDAACTLPVSGSVQVGLPALPVDDDRSAADRYWRSIAP